MTFNFLMQNLINALQWGSFYALIALGYTMVYGIIELINFAHGEVYMFGAYLALTFANPGAAAFSNPGQVARGLVALHIGPNGGSLPSV